MVSSAFLQNIRAANNHTVQDEDIFILGDDEDDEDEAHELASVSPISGPPPPAYPSSLSSLNSESILTTQTSDTSAGYAEDCIPSRYYINSRDTLQGIALRYGANVRYAVRTNGQH